MYPNPRGYIPPWFFVYLLFRPFFKGFCNPCASVHRPSRTCITWQEARKFKGYTSQSGERALWLLQQRETSERERNRLRVRFTWSVYLAKVKIQTRSNDPLFLYITWQNIKQQSLRCKVFAGFIAFIKCIRLISGKLFLFEINVNFKAIVKNC